MKKLKKSKKVKNKKEIKVLPENTNTHYRIIITSQNKIMICVYKAMYKKSALSAFSKIITENKKEVRFPVRFSSRDHKLMEAKYELVLMKSRTIEDTETPLLRNEYGQLVPHVSNSTKMIIYKKEEFLFEESFWVYGFNPKFQRKQFHYIVNEIVLKDLKRVKYPMKTIFVYRNKVIIENDYDFDMIICKNENDSARLYTEIEKEVSKLRYKSVFFSGIARGVTKERLEEKILEKTGWTLEKVRRKSTRP